MQKPTHPVVKVFLTLVVVAGLVRIGAAFFATDAPRRATTFEEPSLAVAVEVALYQRVGAASQAAAEASSHCLHADDWKTPNRAHGPGNVQVVEVILTDGRRFEGKGTATCGVGPPRVPLRAIFEGGKVKTVYTDAVGHARPAGADTARLDAHSLGGAIVDLRPQASPNQS
jgi:hypothetical protein